MTVRIRILSQLIGLLLIGGTTCAVALAGMVRLGQELQTIAGYDVALTRTLSEVAAGHLEQSVEFERALRFASRDAGGPSENPRYQKATEEFDRLAAGVWRELQRGREIAGDASALPRPGADVILALLEDVDREHNEYAHGVRQVFELAERGELGLALALAGRGESAAHEFDQTLGHLLVEVSSSTERASRQAESDQRRAIAFTGGLSAVALLLGVLVTIRSFRLVSEIKFLGGLLPICASCKKIRDDRGYWNQLESYLEAHSEAEFTHGLCGDCQDQMQAAVGKGRKGALVPALPA
jgi:hypothetical protein